jgi:hypothetical protein
MEMMGAVNKSIDPDFDVRPLAPARPPARPLARLPPAWPALGACSDADSLAPDRTQRALEKYFVVTGLAERTKTYMRQWSAGLRGA